MSREGHSHETQQLKAQHFLVLSTEGAHRGDFSIGL